MVQHGRYGRVQLEIYQKKPSHFTIRSQIDQKKIATLHIISRNSHRISIIKIFRLAQLSFLKLSELTFLNSTYHRWINSNNQSEKIN